MPVLQLIPALMYVLASAVIGVVAGLLLAWCMLRGLVSQMRKNETVALAVWSNLHRHFSSMTGYASIGLFSSAHGRIVFPLDEVSRALDAHDVLTHEPVSVQPPSEPPPPSDGAYDGRA